MKTGLLWVALGSGIGGAGRVFVGAVVSAGLGEAFPYGTLSVNLLGCFVIGWLAARMEASDDFEHSLRKRQFLLSGICGGFTTFSFFALTTQQLLQQGNLLQALLYASATLLGTLVAVALGYGLGQKKCAEGRGIRKTG